MICRVSPLVYINTDHCGKRHFLSVALSQRRLTTHRTIATRVYLAIAHRQKYQLLTKIKIRLNCGERNSPATSPPAKRTSLSPAHVALTDNRRESLLTDHLSNTPVPHTERSQHLSIVSFIIPDARTSRSTKSSESRRSLGNTTREENPLAIDPGSRSRRDAAIAEKEEDNERERGRER